MHDAGSGCKPRYARWARSSVFGHGGMRGRGDATFPRPSSRPRAENRRPDTESGTQYRSPVFEKPPMRDAYPVCAFPSDQARSSVLGVRSSASDRLRCRVPGPRCQIAGARYLVPETWHLPSKNPHTGYAR
jgi:hypothetical protein